MASLSGAPIRKGARGRRLQAVAPRSARAAILCGQETHGQHRGNKQSKSSGYEALYPATWSPVYTVTMLPIIPARGALSSAPTYMHMPCIHGPAGDSGRMAGRTTGFRRTAGGRWSDHGCRRWNTYETEYVVRRYRNACCEECRRCACATTSRSIRNVRELGRGVDENSRRIFFSNLLHRATSDLNMRPRCESVVPDFEQGAGPREVFET